MASLEHLQEDVSPEEVRRLLDEGAVDLIDVREPYEHEAGRIEGAIHVEIPNLTAAAAQLDQERPIVFYCRSGARSAMTTQAFRASGFQAFNLTGGLLAWVAKGLPIVPDDGKVADH
ncbi:MAG TPA: rhodanese-like domain-containing protein [Thermoleophilaceae bacterium]|nr:rhodanese-like domain-containing protein [Thermoleophilaceae bacterium]